MRIILVGAGGVGDAFARIAARRPFFEALRGGRLRPGPGRAHASPRVGDERFVAAQVDASDADSVAALVREHRGSHVMNAVDPRFVMPIFTGAYAAGADYLDMAMSLSQPDLEQPYAKIGVMLGDEQFAPAAEWEQAGRLALVGIGVEPGLSDVFARYAADELFSEIDELGTRDGSNLTVEGYDFAPSFSIWTTIEECLNPPVIWEAGRGWYVTEPFSEPEVFDFPGGIGPVECVQRRARGGDPDAALGRGEAGDLQVRPRAASSSTCSRRCTSSASTAPHRSPYAVARPAAVTLPPCWSRRATWSRRPARPGVPRRGDARRDLRRSLGDRHREGRPAARGVPLPRGRQRRPPWPSTAPSAWSGRPRSTPWWRLELLATGAWKGVGVLGPEAFDAETVPRAAGRARTSRPGGWKSAPRPRRPPP